MDKKENPPYFAFVVLVKTTLLAKNQGRYHSDPQPVHWIGLRQIEANCDATTSTRPNHTAQKMKFSISKCDCGYGHIYWRNP